MPVCWTACGVWNGVAKKHQSSYGCKGACGSWGAAGVFRVFFFHFFNIWSWEPKGANGRCSDGFFLVRMLEMLAVGGGVIFCLFGVLCSGNHWKSTHFCWDFTVGTEEMVKTSPLIIHEVLTDSKLESLNISENTTFAQRNIPNKNLTLEPTQQKRWRISIKVGDQIPPLISGWKKTQWKTHGFFRPSKNGKTFHVQAGPVWGSLVKDQLLKGTSGRNFSG